MRDISETDYSLPRPPVAAPPTRSHVSPSADVYSVMHTKPPFETLVDRHGAAVLRVCRAVVGPDDADDAWSETFLAALRAYPDLPAGANAEAWLVTIAHRKAIDVWRAARRRAATGATADIADARPPVGAADSRFGRAAARAGQREPLTLTRDRTYRPRRPRRARGRRGDGPRRL